MSRTSSRELHHHSSNPWIFKDDPMHKSRKDFGGGDGYIASCHGPMCPIQPKPIPKNVKVVIYMPWLTDSFLLLPIIRNKVSCFSSNYHEELKRLLNPDDEVKVSDVVWDRRVVAFIEYSKFPSSLVKRFREEPASRYEGIDDIAIVQYSLLSGSGVEGYDIDSNLQEALSYLPEEF